MDIEDQLVEWMHDAGTKIGKVAEAQGHALSERNHLGLTPHTIKAFRYRVLSVMLFALHATFQVRMSEKRSEIGALLVGTIMANVAMRINDAEGDYLPIEAIAITPASQQFLVRLGGADTTCTANLVNYHLMYTFYDYADEMKMGGHRFVVDGTTASTQLEAVIQRFAWKH